MAAAAVAPALSLRALQALNVSLSYLALVGSALPNPDWGMSSSRDGWHILDSANNMGASEDFYKMLVSALANPAVTSKSMYTGGVLGSDELLEAVADYTNRFILNVNSTNASKWAAKAAVNADEIAVLPGVSSIIDWATFLLTDAGDSVLIPVPYYGPSAIQTQARNDVEIVPVAMENNVPTPATLQAAFDAAQKAGNPPRMLLLTNPHNPTGNVLTRQQLSDIIMWAVKNDVHVLSDEIYARSVFQKDTTFVSARDVAAQLAEQNPQLAQKLDKLVHVAWGLSKDWGVVGLRVGWMATQNDQLLDALAAANQGQSVVPFIQQAALAHVLRDTAGVAAALDKSAARLRAAHQLLAGNLTDMGIPMAPGSAGPYVWIDLREALTSQSWQGEQALVDLLAKHKLMLAPGAQFGAPEPGFFRMNMGGVSSKDLQAALSKLSNAWDAATAN